MKLFARKSFKFLMIIMLIYALLVATHKGEFWPFSIYPMFSQAGKPWTRALVQDVGQAPDSLVWQATDLNHLHGPVINLNKTNVEQIDFANFISKTKNWDHFRQKALLKMFSSSDQRYFRWMVTKVQGHLTKSDSVIVKAIPLLLVTPDSVYKNPDRPDQYYSSN